MAFTFVAATKNARADAITTQGGAGAKLQVWAGSAGVYTTKLAEWTWTGNTWAAAAAGVLTMNAPTAATVTGLATGTAGIARYTKTDGTTVVIQDMSVGTSGTEVVVSNTAIATGQNCTLNNFTITEV